MEDAAVAQGPDNSDISFGVVGHTERERFCLAEWHTATKIMLPGLTLT